MNRTRSPYWYRFYVGECPVCGRDKSYKERVEGKRPERWMRGTLDCRIRKPTTTVKTTEEVRR